MAEGRAPTQTTPDAPIPPPPSLRDVVLANFPLLGAIGGLIGIATFVAALPLDPDWVQPYLTFLLLAGAVLIWLELLAQWPPALRIDRGPPPPGTPWRLVGFAYVLQLTMVGVIGGFFWHAPGLLAPLLATAIALGLWRFVLPPRVKARPGVPVLLALLAVLASVVILARVHPAYQPIVLPAGSGPDAPARRWAETVPVAQTMVLDTARTCCRRGTPGVGWDAPGVDGSRRPRRARLVARRPPPS